ncbi:Glycosyltransferase involved in cell wall bisynthesis [Pustulibacterium marinum]|uniref:Glycosyltransferase involved in cell wall bisynthesis n=1 Tax=Pustulibacterium marinum TaxID=1224947 RepID=A0A1I7HMX2_9FLAO|nr:glycosyltransferase [Pustulibacterium marinum]SFU62097.1 Glycosyltransferase involved in cell wall bisynthesis [Pustulibacterium marinum]
MKFLIVTHVVHTQKEGQIYGYAPYIREMNIWLKYVDEVIIVAPIENRAVSSIDICYQHTKIKFVAVPQFSLVNATEIVKTAVKLPLLFSKVFSAMKRADHIHLRCPGNMGLIGCVLQIAFPKKSKTAKYAGNWDPKSKQPWTYRLQQKFLRNTSFTKNMQVLVYGDWENETKNIKSFFTATYAERDKETVLPRTYAGKLKFLFVGMLAAGKRPEYAIDYVVGLRKKGVNASLDIFGDGLLRHDLEKLIQEHQVEHYISLRGNQPKDIVQKAYKESHFMILPSKSEGWPKVVAEAMFWGCIPISTDVSCVSFMLDKGKRGIVLSLNLEEDIKQFSNLCVDEIQLQEMAKSAEIWSRSYTTDYFDSEIQKLLH